MIAGPTSRRRPSPSWQSKWKSKPLSKTAARPVRCGDTLARWQNETVSNVQILTTALTVPTAFLAVLMGVLLNNGRLGDIRDLVNRRVDDTKNLLEAKIDKVDAKIDNRAGELRILMEKNHSELLMKFSEMESPLSRIENERRIVQ